MSRSAQATHTMDWERYNRLAAMMNSGRVEESIAGLVKLLNGSSDPTDRASVFMTIANGLRRLGRTSDARLQLTEAAEILGPAHEYFPRVLFQLALLRMDGGNWKDSLREFDVILKKYGPILSTQDHRDLLEEIQRNRGMALAELKRFREARFLLESVLPTEYERESTLCYLGMCDFELKDFEAARQVFQELLSLQPASAFRAYAYYYLGIINFNCHQFARAKVELENALTCKDRWKLSEANLLEWIINTCKALNLDRDVEHYSELLSTAKN